MSEMSMLVKAYYAAGVVLQFIAAYFCLFACWRLRERRLALWWLFLGTGVVMSSLAARNVLFLTAGKTAPDTLPFAVLSSLGSAFVIVACLSAIRGIPIRDVGGGRGAALVFALLAASMVAAWRLAL